MITVAVPTTSTAAHRGDPRGLPRTTARADHPGTLAAIPATVDLYNLTIWEASGNRPAYVPLVLPTLTRRGTRTVLDYGCGIGSDAIPLQQSGLDVIGCDFHSPSTAFLRWRSQAAVPVIEPGELGSITEPDTLWVIDTLDHLLDIETSLGAILPVVDLMVTENLTIPVVTAANDSTSGPFAELTLFAT